MAMAHDTTSDILLWPFTALHLIAAAGALLVAGWGSLLLIAWRTGTVTTTFLTSPGFMIGDLVLLPAAGLLIARHYRWAARSSVSEASRVLQGTALGLATVGTASATIYSTLISRNYEGAWSVPHTLFIWFLAYVLIGYFLAGPKHLSSGGPLPIRLDYLGVAAAVTGHIAIKLSLG